jgi:hypothetical protein
MNRQPSSAQADMGPQLPWWRVPMLWVVLGGPAAVVVAGVITTSIAWRGHDEVIGAEPSTGNAHVPALQARNVAPRK